MPRRQKAAKHLRKTGVTGALLLSSPKPFATSDEKRFGSKLLSIRLEQKLLKREAVSSTLDLQLSCSALNCDSDKCTNARLDIGHSRYVYTFSFKTLELPSWFSSSPAGILMSTMSSSVEFIPISNHRESWKDINLGIHCTSKLKHMMNSSLQLSRTYFIPEHWMLHSLGVCFNCGCAEKIRLFPWNGMTCTCFCSI